MDTMQAFYRGKAARAAGNPLKVFDWDEAARLIKAAKPKKASAGLAEDWGWTGGLIFSKGRPVLDSYTYLASIWATPVLEMDGEIISCFKLEPELSEHQKKWDSKTKWPKSALDILK